MISEQPKTGRLFSYFPCPSPIFNTREILKYNCCVLLSMAIVIHSIGKNRYAYEHYRVGSTIKTKYIGPVDARGRIRDVQVGKSVDRAEVGTTTASLRAMYARIVRRNGEPKVPAVKAKREPKPDVKASKNDWNNKLKSAGLEEEHVRYTGHKDFSKGMVIKLKRKDKSKVGEVYKYKEEGYDEEYVIEEEAGSSDIVFDKDFWEDGSEGKYALTSATDIAPDLRGKGIGTTLVKHQEDLARDSGAKKYYITHVDNPKFWTKMGYKQDRTGSPRTFSKEL